MATKQLLTVLLCGALLLGCTGEDEPSKKADTARLSKASHETEEERLQRLGKELVAAGWDPFASWKNPEHPTWQAVSVDGRMVPCITYRESISCDWRVESSLPVPPPKPVTFSDHCRGLKFERLRHHEVMALQAYCNAPKPLNDAPQHTPEPPQE